MPIYMCDHCEREYKYKRNLKRHIEEIHFNESYWECTQAGCGSTFIRRSYLWQHLSTKHKFSKCDARDITLHARPVNKKTSTTSSRYEDVSSDDDILNILLDPDYEKLDTREL